MIEQILIVSFIVWAIYITMQEGMIFEKLGEFLEDMIDSEYWSKPVHSCVICMTPYYGSAFYWVMFGFSSVGEWLTVVIGAMGLNAILSRFIGPLREAADSTEIIASQAETIADKKTVVNTRVVIGQTPKKPVKRRLTQKVKKK